jgi:hypothetical protein
LPRLLDPIALEQLDATRSRTRLRHQRVRPTPVRLLAAHARLLAPLAMEIAEPRSFLAPVRVGASVPGPGTLAGGLVFAPATGVVMDALRP